MTIIYTSTDSQRNLLQDYCMKKVKSGKTIKAFRPKFSVQKKIPFSDPDKVAKKLSRSFDEFNKSWKNWL